MVFFTLLYDIRVTLDVARHIKIPSDVFDLLTAWFRMFCDKFRLGWGDRPFTHKKAVKYCFVFIGFF